MRKPCLPVALATLVAATAVTSGGCGPTGAAPSIDPLEDQVAYVGSEFTLQMRASDMEGGDLSFSFNSNVPSLGERAELRPYGDGSSAVFRWTPLATDVGMWAFDFTVTDGDHLVTETVQIEVRSSVGQNGAPIFREPLGTGTTLDLSVKTCLDLSIVVEDADSGQVEITQEEPAIEGATLDQTGPFAADWHFCPTPEQISAQDRYMLVLGAKDEENPKTQKNFLIVLRRTPKPDCPGDAPAVFHTPADESTLVGLTIVADITDGAGLKGAPLLYYSSTPPSDPVDVGAMTQTTMLLLSGNMSNGTWGADVPNPVASGGMGDMATLYYVIVAQDNDDIEGDCDHLTQAPATGAYQMTVTNPGGSGGLGLCAACTADVQCGGAGDNCVRMGAAGEYFCFTACSADTDCEADYYCSISSFASIDGVMARQCIPNSYSCGPPPPPVCIDDTYEENDSRTAASGSPALPTGTYDLVSCPDGTADDEDWFKITITADAQVTASIAGGAASDLDLSLVDSTGTLIVKSESGTSSETVTSCLVAGTYYLRVYAWTAVENSYTLTYAKTSMSCSAGMCTDDADEPDDNYMSARHIDYAVPHTSTTNAICADDEDWFRVYLYAGETIYVTLAFTQSTADEDLDLHLYKGTMDLTPCTEAAPASCDATNGQGGTSNENMVKTVDVSSYYYVVVHGWDHSENLYDICMGLSATDCPTLP